MNKDTNWDSNEDDKLIKFVEDLQDIFKNTDETQKLAILDKILSAWYEVKSSSTTHQCKRSEIIILGEDHKPNQ